MDSFLIQLCQIEQSFDSLLKDMREQHIVLSLDHVKKLRDLQEKLCQFRAIDTHNQVLSGTCLKDLGSNWNQGENK